MESNTEFHQLTRCLFSLHKTQINTVATPTEAADFLHRAPQNCTASLFTLNETAPNYEQKVLTTATLLSVCGCPLTCCDDKTEEHDERNGDTEAWHLVVV